jgi:adenine deaminase
LRLHAVSSQPGGDSRPGQALLDEVLPFLALPIGGIVADLHPQDMARMEAGLDDAARGFSCRLPSPFMYLIFLSITAIPDYAITDLGLIDCVSLQAISPPL